MLREYLPFWDRLTEGQRRRLEEGAAVRRFVRGEMVYLSLIHISEPTRP